MKKIYFILFLLALFAGAPTAFAISIKLPYESGERFIVVQGYDSPPTHVGKDYYALDLSQNGCGAYGKAAVASFSGTVLLAQESGYNGGYGTQVLVKTPGTGLVARYAHMIPGTIPATALAVGASVIQGEPLGSIGDTGLVAGAACPEHPGTHIHFAIYGEESDGSFVAYKPEPISGYENIREGNWYLSDNTLAADSVSGLSAIIGQSIGGIVDDSGGSRELASASAVVAAPAEPLAPDFSSTTIFQIATASPSSSIPIVITPPVAIGSVSASPPQTQAAPQLSGQPAAAEGTSTPQASSSLSAIASFDSSTLAIDLAWQAPQDASGTVSYQIYRMPPANGSNTSTAVSIGETTSTTFSYPLADADFAGDDSFFVQSIDDAGAVSLPDPIDALVPNWDTTIQAADQENSNASWYSDNWYDLGTGFYGLIRSLTLEGFVDNSQHFASHLWLDEYLDPNYSELNQTFTISDNAPITDGLAKFTIGGLNIPLQPNKYYRLRTYQDFQNRSVILAGTSATGTAMWNEFIYGTGRVENDYSFYPFMQAVMIPDYPPLQPPNPPASISVSFDSLNSLINVSWPATTDPDTKSDLLTYQFNESTSSVFDDAKWRTTNKDLSTPWLPVVFGNAYLLGVRAIDDLGNISQPSTETWNFPAGYIPIPSQLDHSAGLPGGGAQEITFAATTTVSGIALWTSPGGDAGWCCSESFVSIHADSSGTPGAVITASDPVRIGSNAPASEEIYNFSAPQAFSPGAYWFSLDYGPTRLNDTAIYGSPGDSYSGGQWSAAPGQDAYFRIQQATGP